VRERFSIRKPVKGSPFVKANVYFSANQHCRFSFRNIPPRAANTQRLLRETTVGDTLELSVIKTEYYAELYNEISPSLIELHASEWGVEVYEIRFRTIFT
jgi:hypothetical protein